MTILMQPVCTAFNCLASLIIIILTEPEYEADFSEGSSGHQTPIVEFSNDQNDELY